MAAKNDITGDAIRSKTSTKKYAEGWERIFGKKKDGESSNGRTADFDSANRGSNPCSPAK